MDWMEYLDIAWKLGLLLTGVGTGLWAWLKWSARHDLVTRKDFERWQAEHALAHQELEDALEEGSIRFAKIETKMEHLPTKDDIAGLQQTLAKTGANVDAMLRSMAGMQEQLNMLVQWGKR